MENPNQITNLTGREREKKLASLENQIHTRGRLLADFIESEEYQEMDREFSQECHKIYDNSRKEKTVHLTMNPGTPFPESIRKKEDEEIEKINKKKQEHPLSLQRKVMQEELNKIQEQYNELYGSKRKDNEAERENNLKEFKNKLENVIEKVFTELDAMQEEYLKPLMEYGMTKAGAMNELGSKTPMIRNTITTLEGKLSDLEEYQKKLVESQERQRYDLIDELYVRFKYQFQNYL